MTVKWLDGFKTKAAAERGVEKGKEHASIRL